MNRPPSDFDLAAWLPWLVYISALVILASGWPDIVRFGRFLHADVISMLTEWHNRNDAMEEMVDDSNITVDFLPESAWDGPSDAALDCAALRLAELAEPRRTAMPAWMND